LKWSYNVQLSRFIAVGAAVALIGGSTLFAAGTANAADDFVAASQFGAEGASYPAGWFTGTPPAGVTAGGIASGPTGLSVTGREQILNGTPGTTPAGGLVALATGANLNVVSGNVDFQIALYAGPGQTNFTTLRPDNFGNAGLNPAAGWTTSGAVGTFAANSSHTLADYQGQLASDYQILAYGAFVNAGDTAVISSITWNGVTTRFTPVPTPTATVSPTTVTLSNFTTVGKGVTVHLTGFLPNETIDVGFGAANVGGTTGQTVVADGAGNATFTFVDLQTPDYFGTAAPGTYSVGGTGESSGVTAMAQVTVVADPAAIHLPIVSG
jgi:hypothetical protein